ncbi:MAG TPA: hypothetical protein VGM23_08435, partial [Armatimonadota bacterium]
MHHPAFIKEQRVDDFIRDLSAPVHQQYLRDATRLPVAGQEVDLSSGYRLEIADAQLAEALAVSVTDIQRFLSVCMGVEASPVGYPLRLVLGPPDACPTDAPEAYHIAISNAECRITTRDADGARCALIHLEDEMALRRAPYLPLGEYARWAVIEDRISRSPYAPYRWLTGWELEDESDDYHADEYLNGLMHCGINGIWVAGLLRKMVASKTLPELGPATHQLDVLRRLVAKAAR